MQINRQVIVFDAADLAAESAFWAGLLGGTVVEDDDWHSVLVDVVQCHLSGPTATWVGLRASPEPVAGSRCRLLWGSSFGCATRSGQERNAGLVVPALRSRLGLLVGPPPVDRARITG